MLRERINKTIRERRAAEQHQKELGSDTAAGDSSQPEQPQPVPTTIKNRRSGNHLVKDDKAFASQRRTFDRVLDSLSAGDEAMITQFKEVGPDRMDRWEAVLFKSRPLRERRCKGRLLLRERRCKGHF